METKKEKWEMKDRHYLLKGMKPLTYILRSRSNRRQPLLYFDEEKGYNRELRYSTNQKSPFVMSKMVKLYLGILCLKTAYFTYLKSTIITKLLSLYHPFKDKKVL